MNDPFQDDDPMLPAPRIPRRDGELGKWTKLAVTCVAVVIVVFAALTPITLFLFALVRELGGR